MLKFSLKLSFSSYNTGCLENTFHIVSVISSLKKLHFFQHSIKNKNFLLPQKTYSYMAFTKPYIVKLANTNKYFPQLIYLSIPQPLIKLLLNLPLKIKQAFKERSTDMSQFCTPYKNEQTFFYNLHP